MPVFDSDSPEYQRRYGTYIRNQELKEGYRGNLTGPGPAGCMTIIVMVVLAAILAASAWC